MSFGVLGALNAGPAAYEPRTAWGPWSAAVATLVIFSAAMLLALAICEAVVQIVGAPSFIEPLSSDVLDAAGETSGLIWSLVSQALSIALTLWAARMFAGRPADVLALRVPKPGWSVLLPALLVLLTLVGIYSAFGYLLWPQHVLADLKPFDALLRAGNGPILAIIAVVGAPLAEELLFRGFLLSALARTQLGFIGAALVSNAAWTALHAQYSLLGLGEVFLVGLIMSWLLWRTGSLWVLIFCHAFYNGLILLALYLYPLG